MTDQLIPDLILGRAAEDPVRPAFWLRHQDGFKFMTYRELASSIKALASGLKKLGFKPGERTGIYAGNSPEWGIVYLAVLAAGGAVIPFDPQLKYLEMRAIVARSSIKFLFCSEGSYSDLVQLKSTVTPFPEIISIDAPDETASSDKLTYKKITEMGMDRQFDQARVNPSSMAVLIFTSGTSGDSKGVMLSHENIVSDINAVTQRLNIGTEDRFLSVLPLHHTFEATCGLLYPLSVGASIAYARTLKSADVLADIKELRITLMCGVPLLFEKMYSGLQRTLAKKALTTRVFVDLGQKVANLSKSILNVQAGKVVFKSLRSKAGLDSIRMFVSGGAAINPEISRYFNNLGIVLLQGYGLTETSPVLSVNSADDNNYGSVGKPLPGVEVKIVDQNPQGVGEISVRGKMVMKGYFENPEATAEVMEDGYFRTGDLGFLDAQGHLHITGRKKNVIITPAGKNIYPEEIEGLLEGSPFILEIAVVPRKRSTGEEPVAVVLPDLETITAARNGTPATDEEVKQIIRAEVLEMGEQLAEYKRIKDVIIMDTELPKTSTKKVKRFALMETLKQLGELSFREPKSGRYV